MPGRFAPIVLSRGEQFQPQPLAAARYGAGHWPAGATVHTVFYDTAGGTIADIAGLVNAEAAVFNVAPDEVDIIPAGAHFETFLVEADGTPHQLQYGRVIRKEATFAKTVSTDASVKVLQFRDNFYARKGLVGSKWVPVLGKPTIFDNSDDGLPNGVGPHTIFFTDAAMRFYAPLNTDSVTLSVNLLNPGAGKSGIVVCSNASMTSYLFAMFESGVSNNRIHLGVGSGPIAMVDKVATVAHTVVNNGNYKLRYDDLTKRVSLWNSAMTSEYCGWTDEDEIVPHGLGHRYFGANWQASLLSSGIQLSTIAVQDQV